MLTPIVFTTTSKSRPLMILDDYLYTRDRPTDTKTYWHCENQKSLNCHYRLHTCNSTSTETHILILKQTGTHLTSCNRDLIKITLRKFRKDVLDRTKSTQETTNAVLSQCSSKLPDPARIKLPPLDHIKRTMQKQRKRIDLPPAPNNMDFPCIPTILQTTKRNDNFLRIDTDPESTLTNSFLHISLGLDRLLVFNSPEQTAILESALPEIFYQLYVIHAVHREHVIPVVFCLLQRKSTATCQEIINKIVEFAPTWSPRIIMLAFEKAVANVLSNNFPQVCLSGCYFHLRQSIHRKLQKSEDDVGFAHGIHKMAALAFINPNDVINAFADVSTHLGDDFQSMLDYFEDTYIGRFHANGSRAKPLFNFEYWNVYERTKTHQMRTNSSAEA
ncbi:unnamed protein product [Rotaria socialis]|uniref:MULE transposase domain-containing protein n=1 Tax=Rotaria socialis TaxID=392032 RepID=A0A821ILW1_9BILA|nr:unnamed protein product [Rotaria socialis]